MIAGDLSLNQRIPLSQWQWTNALLTTAFFALALAIVFAFQPIQEPIRLDSGQVSPKTILAPERVTFVSEIQTQEARAKAAA